MILNDDCSRALGSVGAYECSGDIGFRKCGKRLVIKFNVAVAPIEVVADETAVGVSQLEFDELDRVLVGGLGLEDLNLVDGMSKPGVTALSHDAQETCYGRTDCYDVRTALAVVVAVGCVPIAS